MYEKFYAKLWVQGETSIVLTVPSNIVKYAGYKAGDEIVVMIKKKEE